MQRRPLLFWIGLLPLLAAPTLAAGPKTVAITAFIEHPALDAVRKGLEDELAERGFAGEEAIRIVFRSADGRVGRAEEIAHAFASTKADVIVAISTPSAQAAVRATTSTPIVFTAVADPIAAGLVEDPSAPGGNVTGISDHAPIKRNLDLVREVVPAARRLGVVYTPSEDNSVVLVERLKEAAADYDLTVVEARAVSQTDVGMATEGLVERVDAIYVPADNTAMAALDAIVAVAEANDLPLLASDVNAVPRGAIAALGFNYYEVGRQTGRIVARVLAGEDPGAIPVEPVRASELYVNPRAAAAMGVTLPETLLARAKLVGE